MSAAEITGGSLALLLAWAVFAYNRLVRERNRVRAAWSDVDVQLKRRHDLVPQLVAAVEGYAAYERAVLAEVTALRARSEAAGRVRDIGAVESDLARGLTRLVALAESYPDLKASESFLALQEDLVEVEDHIQFARRYYNGAVRIYNTRIETFPDLVVAGSFDFAPEDFFQIQEDEQRAAPRIG